MNSNECVSAGRSLCDELYSNNSGDYLTNKIVDEVSDIIDEIEKLDLDKKIKNISDEVERKKREIQERERRKKEEQNIEE